MRVGIDCSHIQGCFFKFYAAICIKEKDEKITVLDREKFEAALCIPGTAVHAFGKRPVRLVHSSGFISTFHIEVPTRVNPVVHIGDDR